MSERSIRVLCVDDHSLLAEGLRTRLALESDMTFVGWLRNAEDLLREVEQTRADVVLLDIEMPGPDPFERLQDLQRHAPHVRTILFSAYVRDHYIDAAFRGGAWGYVSKSDEPGTVIGAIRKVMRGEFAFGLKVSQRCRPQQGRKKDPRPSSRLDQLTARELQILRMIGKGLSRLEIARVIHRSPKTVDNHRGAIMEKLGIRDRGELVRFAISEGLA